MYVNRVNPLLLCSKCCTTRPGTNRTQSASHFRFPLRLWRYPTNPSSLHPKTTLVVVMEPHSAAHKLRRLQVMVGGPSPMIPALVSCGRVDGCLFGHGQRTRTLTLSRRSLSFIHRAFICASNLYDVTAARAFVKGVAAFSARTVV